jgi:hypothetical protein
MQTAEIEQRKTNPGAQHPTSVFTVRGAGCRGNLPAFPSKEKYFLDIPFYRAGLNTQISTSFDSLHICSPQTKQHSRVMFVSSKVRLPAEPGSHAQPRKVISRVPITVGFHQ